MVIRRKSPSNGPRPGGRSHTVAECKGLDRRIEGRQPATGWCQCRVPRVERRRPAALARGADGLPVRRGARPSRNTRSPCMASRRLPADFTGMRYANPQAPKGGRLVQGILGTFDSLNPLIVKGLALPSIRGYVIESLMARGYDEPFTLYGLLAAIGRDRRRAQLRHLQSQSASALLRRQAGHAGRRRVLLAAPARQGPAQSPHLLFQGRESGGHRAECRALRSVRRQRSRIAAHPRSDAGAAEARDQSRDLRGDDIRAAGRQRPLCRQGGEAGRERHLRAQSVLLGRRLADQSRLLEFRRDPVRLLSRRQFVFRSVQERPLRRARGARSVALADRL